MARARKSAAVDEMKIEDLKFANAFAKCEKAKKKKDPGYEIQPAPTSAPDRGKSGKGKPRKGKGKGKGKGPPPPPPPPPPSGHQITSRMAEVPTSGGGDGSDGGLFAQIRARRN